MERGRLLRAWRPSLGRCVSAAPSRLGGLSGCWSLHFVRRSTKGEHRRPSWSASAGICSATEGSQGVAMSILSSERTSRSGCGRSSQRTPRRSDSATPQSRHRGNSPQTTRSWRPGRFLIAPKAQSSAVAHPAGRRVVSEGGSSKCIIEN